MHTDATCLAALDAVAEDVGEGMVFDPNPHLPTRHGAHGTHDGAGGGWVRRPTLAERRI
jgi:hypothetical protein